MRDLSEDIRELRRRVVEAAGYLKVDEGRNRLVELEAEISRPDLWDDADRAKQVNADYAAVKDDLDTHDSIAALIDDIDVLHDLAREEGDESVIEEIDASIADVSSRLD